MLAVGALAGLEPGQIVRKQASDGPPPDGLPYAPQPVDFKKPRKVIYLIGEVPSSELPPCDYLIYQNALPSGSSRQPDLILPAALFTESTGTMISAEGRILQVRQAVTPLEDTKPDWLILSRISEKLGKGKPKYLTISALQQELKKQVKGVSDSRKRVEFERISHPTQGAAAAQPFVSSGNGRRESYRGIALAEVVAGMKVLGKRRNNE
jgi:NADH dehydrogenase/NADH:ubiquinone oxidoreductase subunit G